MTPLTLLRRVLPAVLVLAALSAFPCPAVTKTVSVGFDGIVKRGIWTPVTVRFENPGQENLNGSIFASQTDYDRGGVPLCAAKVALPGNSKKLYHVYTKPAEYGESMAVRFVLENGATETKQARMTVADIADFVIVSVGDRASRLSFLSGEKIKVASRPPSSVAPGPGASPTTEVAVYVGSVSPDELPDRPAAYESVDVLVVSGSIASEATPAALKAVSMWVASGGALVISGGPDYRRLQNDFCDEMLPVTITGTATVPSMSGFASLAGGAAFPYVEVAVANSSVKPGIGNPMAQEWNVPLIAQRDYGAGRVWFFAFDPMSSPFRDWNGQTEFWKSIIRSSTGGPMFSTFGFMSENYGYSGGPYYPGSQGGQIALSSIVTQNPSVKAPSLGTIGFFLIAYIVVLVPVNYFVLSKRNRLELAWVTTPAIIVFFTLGVYGVGYTMKGGKLQLREATVIEGSSGARYARALTDASLFSPARRNYKIEVDDPLALCQVVPSNERERLQPAFISEKAAIERVPIAMWASKSFESVSGVDLGGAIESNLVLEGNTLRGSITNNTRLILTNCAVYYSGGSTTMPDIPSGGTAEIRQPGSPPAVGQPVPDPTVASDLQQFVAARASTAGAPVLVAIAKVSPRVFDAGKAQVESATCCVFRLSYKVGNRFNISAGAVKGSIIKYENAEIEYPGPNQHAVRLNSMGYFIAEYELPLSVGAKVSVLSIHGAVTDYGGNNNSPKVSASVFNFATGKWYPIELSSGGYHLVNANRYVGPSSEVRLKVKSLGPPGSSIRAKTYVTAEGGER